MYNLFKPIKYIQIALKSFENQLSCYFRKLRINNF